MMNREIQFRCWNVDEKIMHSIAFPSWNGSIEVWRGNKPQSEVQYLSNGPSDEGILMQMTGLKDRNGKDIYEGDILKAMTLDIGPMRIAFEDGCFVAYDRFCLWGRLFTLIENRFSKLYSIEVIGNIFESPLLLNTQS